MPFQKMTPKTLAARTKRLPVLAAVSVVLGIASLGLASAAPARADSPTPLSLSLSVEAMNEAVRACSAKGFKVAVAIVDPDGVIKTEGRGDGSPIHSQRFSFRKAFTIVSMGPMFGVDTTAILVKTLSEFPQGLSNVAAGSTDLLFLPGGVLFKSGSETVGAIGVSGAPRSLDDEACAQAAVAKIQDRLNPGAKKD